MEILITMSRYIYYIYLMKKICYLFLLLTFSVFSQNDAIAKDYFNRGDFEKALYEYKKLYAQSPYNINYINGITETYQQLEQYQEANELLEKILTSFKYPALYVDLGHNYILQDDELNAKLYFDKAMIALDENPNNVFAVARAFQKYSMLDEAVAAYERGMELNPEFNFNLQLAQLYGEQGKIEKMFTRYVEFAESNPVALSNIKRAMNDFISEDGTNENNILLRKIVLKKLQQGPSLLWNQLLSWLFIQQKDYNKAFTQEKAIFNRQPESLASIESLALNAIDEGEHEVAQEIFTYLIQTAQDLDTQLSAHHQLLLLLTKTSDKSNYPEIKSKYLGLFETYGKMPQTLDLQISFAHFLAFYLDAPQEATKFLESSLELPINLLQQAKVKLELGDILVLQEKFNQALIYFTQIQRNLKNSTVSQEARFKVAQASYYKGDFKWAESQLKILKSSTSQLIANDALDLKLLITDNKYEDSLQTALKLYAKADLLAFQNKKDEAITLLNKILEEHKTEPIIAQALYKQGQLFEDKQQFEKALVNYEMLIANYRDGILMDDGLYRLSNIYLRHLDQPEKAKELLEQIIFNHADSIYFVEARKKYRELRGDAIN